MGRYNYNSASQNCGEIIGWDIQGLMKDEKSLQAAQREWMRHTQNRSILNDSCTCQELDKEVKWIEALLTQIINTHSKSMRVTPFSKRWWNKEVAEARKIWAREKKLWGKISPNRKKLKQARNAFYHIVRRVKRECWQNFLLGEEGLNKGDVAKIQPEDKNRCWKALQYTKPRTNCTTPTLQGPNNQMAVTMQDKEALVRSHAFPKPPVFQGNEYQPGQGSAYLSVNQETVARALLCQSVKKAPGPNMHNFRALRLIWTWDADRITSLVQQAIRLQYHHQPWRHAKGILMEKPNKRDRTLVKSYRVISLLNCLGKVVEKLVAEMLSQSCETKGSLHQGQMGGRKHRSAIDAAALMIHKVHEIWEDKQIAGALLMDVKGAFDHVSRAKLVQRMADLGIDDDLIGWTQSFLTDRSVELVIDGFTNPRQKVESGIPQGSPVSPILFLIYISGMFSVVEEQLPNVTCVSFVDDLGFITADRSISKIAEILEKAGHMMLEEGANNAVIYDMSKTEAALFSKAYRQKLTRLVETRMRIGGETV